MKYREKLNTVFRKVMLSTGCLATCLLLTFAGCGDSVFNPLSPIDEGEKTPGDHDPMLGLMEITISGIGTAKMTATADPASPSVAANMTGLPTATGKDGSIQLQSISNGSFTMGTRGTGYRYFYATFKVRNADSDGDLYSKDLKNLTFLAVDTDGSASVAETYGVTAVSQLRLFNGNVLAGPDADALAEKILPTSRVTHIPGDPDGLRVVRTDVLQVYTEMEAGDVQTSVSDPDINDIFPYGFIVRTPDVTSGSRTLPNLTSDGRTGNDQYDGLVTFAFKIPLQEFANQDPFEISFMFLAVEDDQTRITQSIQARSANEYSMFATRAGAISASKVSVFPTGSYTGTIPLRGFCTVRVAGEEGSATAVIGTDCLLDTWTGNISGTWGDNGNWNPGLPSIASPVLIPDGVANAPMLAIDATVSSVTINGTPLIIKGHTLIIKELPSELYQ